MLGMVIIQLCSLMDRQDPGSLGQLLDMVPTKVSINVRFSTILPFNNNIYM